MNYEKRDTVVTKIWQAVRNFKQKLDDTRHQGLLMDLVEGSLQSVEPESEVNIISCVDGIVRMKWTGSDEVIRIQRTEGVMEVRVGA